MYSSSIVFISFSLLIISINCQTNDEQKLPPAPQVGTRTSKASFDAEFTRGRCPEKFYQIGDECLFFSNDGKIYAWQTLERICSNRIARMLNQQSSTNFDQPNMTPTRGVRQIVLNTPQKTEILRAFHRDYSEQNFGVRLPLDYDTLKRCRDGNDDKWPLYCSDTQRTNSSCYETVAHGQNDICLREVDCNQQYLRLVCEFTLPGSEEITNSKFRHCPKIHGFHRLLPRWAWILIIIVGAVLLLGILTAIIAAILGIVLKKKVRSKKRSLPEPRAAPEKVIRVPVKREDPAAEPMLVRTGPTNVSSTDYLQPRSTPIDNTTNS